MNECVYNYDLEDNLKATEQLLLQKYKKKTGIVSVLVVVLSIMGIMTSIGMIIAKSSKWYIGLISAILLICYFFVDKVLVKFQLKKQKEFFYSSNLNKITKVKVQLLEDKTITENFYHKEKLVGTNTYDYKDLTVFKVQDGNIYLIYNDSNVVLLKKNCLTEKTALEFFKLREKFTNLNKKSKNKKS